MNADELRKIIDASPLTEHADAIMNEARPAVKMNAFFVETGDIPTGASRMGGAPDLPPGTSWPQNNGRPVEFLTQIDFAEAMRGHAVPGLPTAGSLAIFHDFKTVYDGNYDDPRRWQLLHFDDPSDSLVRMNQPGEPVEAFNLCELGFEPEICLPSDLVLRYSSEENGQEAWDYFDDALWGMEYGPCHRLGGHPMLIQSDPLDYDGRQFVMQIDTDDEVGWMWGDAGRVYCWGEPAGPIARLLKTAGSGQQSVWPFRSVTCGEEFY